MASLVGFLGVRFPLFGSISGFKVHAERAEGPLVSHVAIYEVVIDVLLGLSLPLLTAKRHSLFVHKVSYVEYVLHLMVSLLGVIVHDFDRARAVEEIHFVLGLGSLLVAIH